MKKHPQLIFYASHAIAGFVLALAASAPSLVAEEPSERFLKLLRANRLFDMAELYLDRVEKGAAAPKSIKSAIELERAQIYLEAAGATRNPKIRDEYFIKAESSLNKFLGSSKSSPRAGEARLQLGKLLLTRAMVLQGGKQVDQPQRIAARTSLDKAAKVFDAMIEEVRAKLKAMQGNKIDSRDAKAVALRDKLRGDFLLAQLLSGDVRERAADTFSDKAPERTKRLDAALAKYKELASKYSDFVPGAQAAFNIGRVQEKKGDANAALAAYRDTLEQPDIDALRNSKTEAASRAVAILMAKKPPASKEAIKIGQGWMDELRPNERTLPGWQSLRTSLAKAYMGLAKTQKPGEARKSKASARLLLVAASKVPGTHIDETRKLLAEVGVATGDDAAETPVEPPKSYGEALAACRELMEEAKVAGLPIEILKQKIGAGGGNVAALKTQLADAQAGVQKYYAMASSVIQQGLRLTTSEDTQESINQGRFFLSWLESKRGRFWESAVVGEFVSRRFPTDPLALQCGLVALTAYQMMLQKAEESRRPSIMRKIEPLGLFLLEKWPDDPNSMAAANLLFQIAIIDDRWDDAEKHLARIPADSPQRGKFQSTLGQLLWNTFLKKEKSEDVQGAAAALKRSTKHLQAGVAGVKRDGVNSTVMISVLLLAKAKLRAKDPKAALSVLENQTYGPLVRLKGNDAIAEPAPGFISDSYRTALQALVSQLTQGGSNKELLPKAEQLMSDLRDAMQGQPQADKRLIGIYYSLAKDIRSQIDDAPPAEKQKLIDAFKLFLGNVGRQSPDVTTAHWVAQTFIEMGKAAMGDKLPPATGQAKDLLDGATEQLRGLLDKEQNPDSKRQIRFELATTSRLLGDYKEAINQLEAILKEKNSMLDAQVEAALSYQQWALSPNFKKKYVKKALQSAMSGARPNGGKNTIWGWGKLAKLTTSRPAFKATFFDARYRLAECFLLIAQKSIDPKDKGLYAPKAEKIINDTLKLYPDLGGRDSFDRFDKLMRQIQQTQGKKPTGLPAPAKVAQPAPAKVAQPAVARGGAT